MILSTTDLVAQSGSNGTQFQVKFLDLDIGKKLRVKASEVTINHEELVDLLTTETLPKHVVTKRDLKISFKANGLSKSQRNNFKPGTHIGRIKIEHEGWGKNLLLPNATVVSSKKSGDVFTTIINYDIYL